jgi:hypothetical protein
MLLISRILEESLYTATVNEAIKKASTESSSEPLYIYIQLNTSKLRNFQMNNFARSRAVLLSFLKQKTSKCDMVFWKGNVLSQISF